MTIPDKKKLLQKKNSSKTKNIMESIVQFEEEFKKICDDSNLQVSDNFLDNYFIVGYENTFVTGEGRPLGRRIPITYAALKNRKDIIEKILSKRQYLLNRRDNLGDTALMVACTNGHTDLVAYLLQNGADPTISDNYHYYPLMAASQNGQADIVDLLLQHDTIAQFINKKKDGKTALDYATENNHFAIAEKISAVRQKIQSGNISPIIEQAPRPEGSVVKRSAGSDPISLIIEQTPQPEGSVDNFQLAIMVLLL